MTIRVQLYAAVREQIGADFVEIENVQTITELRTAMSVRWPGLSQLIQRSALAVNFEYVTNDHVLKANDEVALIPPVSGGMV